LGGWEGVTPEARKMTIEAAKAKGVSVHEWLESVVREAARAEPSQRGDDARASADDVAKAGQNIQAVR
jgi:hypothetical protein